MLLITPPLAAAYVWLDRPDPGPKSKPADTPKYKVMQVAPKENLTPDQLAWIEDVMARHAEVMGSPKTCPVRDGDKNPKGVDPKFPGCYTIKFATKFAPDIVDCAKQHLPPNMRIASGDIIRVAYTENLVETGAVPGLFFRMNAVQLVEKRSLSHSHIAGQAFDEIEGGFTAADWNRIHEEGMADAGAGDKTDF